MPAGWEWDETLYLGSAPHYVRGRPPYTPGLAAEMARVLALNGRGRVLDVGRGPGGVTLPLAPYFSAAVGVDPDPGMLAEGARRALGAGIATIHWVNARAEKLPTGLGVFRVATFAQSFHWMDRERVAAVMLSLLEPGGAFVHIGDVKENRAAPDRLPHPPPPYVAIQVLIQGYLGPIPRAGQGVLRFGSPDGEALVLRGTGFGGPEYVRLPASTVRERSVDDLVAWVYSLSGSAPHLFGARLPRFASELRRLLGEASPAGVFAELPADTELFVWRAPQLRS